MKYVLGTNTVSFLMRGDEAVSGRLIHHPRHDVLLPQPVLAEETEYGLQRLPRSARLTRLRQRFTAIAAELARADWTDDVSAAFGTIKATLERKGQPLEDLDVAVAAHALGLGAVLVTDDTAHLRRIEGLKIENWRDDRG